VTEEGRQRLLPAFSSSTAQELGRLPWFAALFFRAFFLRDFFAMWISVRPRGQPADGRRPGSARPVCPRVGTVIGYRHPISADEEDITMADEIRAEMVANVWKIVAAAGAEVEEGDTLVILESMKMEIPVLAESDGVVAQLAVNEGDVVQEGDLIAVIE
jgi:acetyl-CoA carboxylase biotin carboxyl carrier protein